MQQNSLIESKLQFSTVAFMNRVYFWMTVGILITGLVAYFVQDSYEIWSYFQTHPDHYKAAFIGIVIGQLALVIVLSALINKMNSTVATILYLLYAVSVGLTFSVIFKAYTLESIAGVFFLTSFAFAGLSIFGFITKKDLGPLGSFCMIGLFGLLGVMLLSFFIPALMSNSVQFAISVLGIAIFAGLTAYDTQAIKNLNLENQSLQVMHKTAIIGALKLYLDFINLFIMLLRLFGGRR